MSDQVRQTARGKSGRKQFAALLLTLFLVSWLTESRAQLPNTSLDSLFPPGGQAGTTLEVEIGGGNLTGVTGLRCSHAGVLFERSAASTDSGAEGDEKKSDNLFRVTIAPDVPPGLYDVRAIGDNGMSSAHLFAVGRRTERLETEPNDTPHGEGSGSVELSEVEGITFSGRIGSKGDLDHHAFRARAGQRVIVECWVERLGSALVPVLEVYSSDGRRLARNWSHRSTDPLIDFTVPEDGLYYAKIFDLTFSGGAGHVYRLEVDTGPRVLFTLPAALVEGETTRVQVFGWNLGGSRAVAQRVTATGSAGGVAEASSSAAAQTVNPNIDAVPNQSLDRVEVELVAPAPQPPQAIPVYRAPSTVGLDGFAYDHPRSNMPVFVGVVEDTVQLERGDNNTPATAQALEYPGEVNGQLVAGDEQDWYSFEARRGEVLWFEGFGERIGSPVDLDVSVLNARGERELLRLVDDPRNPGGTRFPASHLDPSGRFVVPKDGRYLLMVRSLVGGLGDDPSRVYRLSIHREEPDFDLVTVSRHGAPAGINVERGGREIVDVLVFRRRGQSTPIQIVATKLPPGIECEPVWLGPGVDSAPLVFTGINSAESIEGTIEVIGSAPLNHPDLNQVDLNQVDVSKGGTSNSFLYTGHDGDYESASVGLVTRRAVGGAIVRGGTPNGLARITAEVPIAIRGSAPVIVHARATDTRFSQGSVITIAVDIQRRYPHEAEVKLTSDRLPSMVPTEKAYIEKGRSSGFVCFYLPPQLPIGYYSIVVKAETEVATQAGDDPKSKAVSVYSNPVSFEVYPPPFVVVIDPNAPRKIHRGETLDVRYTGVRQNGFIGKIHTEMVAPAGVFGIRGRGVTFVGQSESGSIRIVANDDAPLGQIPFLQFEGLGTVEDKAIFRSSAFVYLEIIEKEEPKESDKEAK